MRVLTGIAGASALESLEKAMEYTEQSSEVRVTKIP